jgi:type VI secretion system protein ImpF
MAGARFHPTLFDKLISGSAPASLAGADDAALESAEVTRSYQRFYATSQLDNFGEHALRATIRRDLAWLLNTTNFASTHDLADFPQVRTSVLNYGVASLSGQSVSDWTLQQRVRDIQEAVTAFEPRLNPDSLVVDARAAGERENAITYVIEGEIGGGAGRVGARFLTDVEADTGAVTVRD